MIARLESGEVLLTTSITKVSIQIIQIVLAWYATLAQFDAKGIAIQFSHAGGLTEREPAPGIVAAGQLDLHVALPFARLQGQTGECLLVKIKGNTHKWKIRHGLELASESLEPRS